ncbi:unnamed protein product [Gongylonema pulchrum]|uniref:Inhibitor_I29 domain-containing protein n=1 Tax=Gongylonema pulchrum TaxID=637853 RepID=A0A183DBA8_9BILA|nr:unnamed protein product [Gongylonema pulchrum]
MFPVRQQLRSECGSAFIYFFATFLAMVTAAVLQNNRHSEHILGNWPEFIANHGISKMEPQKESAKLTANRWTTAEDLLLGKNARIREGDIMLTKEQEKFWKQNRKFKMAFNFENARNDRFKRQAYHDNSNYPYYFWENGTIPYSFQPGLCKS